MRDRLFKALVRQVSIRSVGQKTPKAKHPFGTQNCPCSFQHKRQLQLVKKQKVALGRGNPVTRQKVCHLSTRPWLSWTLAKTVNKSWNEFILSQWQARANMTTSRSSGKESLLKFLSSLVFRYSRWPSHNRNSGDGHHGQNRSSIGTAELPDKGGLSCAVATEQKKTPRFMEICLGQRAGTRIFITSETSLDACNQKSVVGMLKFESSVTEKSWQIRQIRRNLHPILGKVLKLPRQPKAPTTSFPNTKQVEVPSSSQKTKLLKVQDWNSKKFPIQGS